jgi:hypothetical protein
MVEGIRFEMLEYCDNQKIQKFPKSGKKSKEQVCTQPCGSLCFSVSTGNSKSMKQGVKILNEINLQPAQVINQRDGKPVK